MCKFGVKCSRLDCTWGHPDGRKIDEPCRFGDRCTNDKCPYGGHASAPAGAPAFDPTVAPPACRDGRDCTRVGCRFMHPHDPEACPYADCPACDAALALLAELDRIAEDDEDAEAAEGDDMNDNGVLDRVPTVLALGDGYSVPIAYLAGQVEGVSLGSPAEVLDQLEAAVRAHEGDAAQIRAALDEVSQLRAMLVGRAGPAQFARAVPKALVIGRRAGTA